MEAYFLISFDLSNRFGPNDYPTIYKIVTDKLAEQSVAANVYVRPRTKGLAEVWHDRIDLQIELFTTRERAGTLAKAIGEIFSLPEKKISFLKSDQSPSIYALPEQELINRYEQHRRAAPAEKPEATLAEFCRHVERQEFSAAKKLLPGCGADFKALGRLLSPQYLQIALEDAGSLLALIDHLPLEQFIIYYQNDLVPALDTLYNLCVNHYSLPLLLNFDFALRRLFERLGLTHQFDSFGEKNLPALSRFLKDFAAQRAHLLAAEAVSALRLALPADQVHIRDYATRDFIVYKTLAGELAASYAALAPLLTALRASSMGIVSYRAPQSAGLDRPLTSLAAAGLVRFSHVRGTYKVSVVDGRHWNFLQGKWCEYFVRMALEKAAAAAGEPLVIYQNVTITLAGGTRELDIIYRLRGALYYLEVKTSSAGVSEEQLARYEKTRRLLAIPREHCAIVYLQGAGREKKSFPFVPIEEYVKIFQQQLRGEK